MTSLCARKSVAFAVAMFLGGLFATGPARAQTGFYHGKQIQILVAGTAGGGIDIGARIIARYLGKYLPGNPNLVVQLMPAPAAFA